jgi:hypothetical protein
MILTADQLKALDQGEPIPVRIEDKDCVVVHKEVFDRLKGLLYDNSEWVPREAYPAILRAIDSDDEDTDQYLDYLKDS